MTTLMLVRHGQTAVNRSGCFQGRTDPPLTDAGVGQAEAAVGVLAAWIDGPVRIVSSPLGRARATAEILALGLDHTAGVAVDDRLIELSYGDWEGRALASVSAEEWAHWRRTPDFAPPGGESLLAVATRVRDFLDAWSAEAVPTIAVSHVSPIKAAIAAALGVDHSATWRMHLDLASVSRIMVRGSELLLSSYNQVPV